MCQVIGNMFCALTEDLYYIGAVEKCNIGLGVLTQ